MMFKRCPRVNKTQPYLKYYFFIRVLVIPIDVQTIVSWNIIILFIALTIFGLLLIIIWTSTLVKAIKEKRFKIMLPEWLMITKENKKYWIITMIIVIVAIVAYNIGFTSIIFALGLPFIIIGLWSIWLHANGKIIKCPTGNTDR